MFKDAGVELITDQNRHFQSSRAELRFLAAIWPLNMFI